MALGNIETIVSLLLKVLPSLLWGWALMAGLGAMPMYLCANHDIRVPGYEYKLVGQSPGPDFNLCRCLFRMYLRFYDDGIFRLWYGS